MQEPGQGEVGRDAVARVRVGRPGRRVWAEEDGGWDGHAENRQREWAGGRGCCSVSECAACWTTAPSRWQKSWQGYDGPLRRSRIAWKTSRLGLTVVPLLLLLYLLLPLLLLLLW